MFVRGNMLSVVNAHANGVSNKGLQTGDTLLVGARKKGGWLRVRCSRTGEVISIRSGRHLCLASKAARPASQIDLLIRENQLASAETTIQELKCSRDNWMDSYNHLVETTNLQKEAMLAREARGQQEAAEVQIDNKKEIERLEEQLAIAHRLLDEATKQNAELLDERSILQEKLKKSEEATVRGVWTVYMAADRARLVGWDAQDSLYTNNPSARKAADRVLTAAGKAARKVEAEAALGEARARLEREAAAKAADLGEAAVALLKLKNGNQ